MGTDHSPIDDGRSMRERMLARDWYQADDPELEAMLRRARRLQDRFNRTEADADDERRAILGELLGSVGDGTVIRPPFFCDYGSHITIGARCFANFGLVALDCAPIAIGDDVLFATNVQLLPPTHPLDADLRIAQWEAAHPIAIGDGAWLGGGVVVVGGVTIGERTVVGAGAVVTRDLPPGVLAVGNPARPIRDL